MARGNAANNNNQEILVDQNVNQTDEPSPTTDNTARLCFNFFLPLRNCIIAIYALALVLFVSVLVTMIVIFTKKSNQMDRDFDKHKEEMKREFDKFGEGVPENMNSFGKMIEKGYHEIKEVNLENVEYNPNQGSVHKHIESTSVENYDNKSYKVDSSQSTEVKSSFRKPGNCPHNPKVSDNSTVYVGEILDIINEIVRKEKDFDPVKEFNVIDAFKTFANKYWRCYRNRDQFLDKFNIFRRNYYEIEAHNADPKSTYRKGINQFADHSESEVGFFLSSSVPEVNSLRLDTPIISFDSNLLGSTPVDKTEHFDWRDEGVVSPVRSQSGCSSCWAMAITSAIDAAFNIKYKGDNMVTSPQHLLDCVSDRYTCSTGGVLDVALDFVTRSPGVCLESDMPYMAMKKVCYTQSCKRFVKVKDYGRLSRNGMQKGLKTYGPIVVGIAVSRDFLQYESGVFNGGCGRKVNHAVLITGYGYDKKTNQRYWIIKNSWGVNWGDKGYVLMSRDTKKGGSLCRIDSLPHVVEI